MRPAEEASVCLHSVCSLMQQDTTHISLCLCKQNIVYSVESNSITFHMELEHYHHPPRVNQHQESKHIKAQAITIARLLVTYTQIFDSSLEFFIYLFHDR